MVRNDSAQMATNGVAEIAIVALVVGACFGPSPANFWCLLGFSLAVVALSALPKW